jgi:hypothetical protein
VEIRQEGHAEKLEYGWWEAKRGHVLLPRTLGHKNNYVLTPEELAHYDLFLVQFTERIIKERERVGVTLRAYRQGRRPKWEQIDPTCITFAHVMEFMLVWGKGKLEMLHLLNYVLQRRVGEQRGTGQAHEGPSGADS